MSETPLEVSIENGIARLVINRPDQGNALNDALSQALLETAVNCDEDPAVRLVTLTGRGRLFCGGGDIQGFNQHSDALGAHLKLLTNTVHGAVLALLHMRKPLVTIVNGPAAGAGLSLAMLGDIVIAARSAHFTSAYTAIGLTPDCGLTWVLPRIIGLRRAQEMVLTNRRLSAEEAVAWGLATRVVDDADLGKEADALAQQLAAGATGALGLARNLLSQSLETSLGTQLEQEARNIAQAANGAEAQEGVAAFVAKRKPVFPR